MNLSAYLQNAAQQINAALLVFSEESAAEVSAVSAHLQPLMQLLNAASEGGKRIRATLVLLGFELTGKEFTPDMLKPALAFEIFQTAILVHDDIIDKSPTRRGKPTLYKQLEATKKDAHYGVSQAICLGDIGMFLAVRLVGESNFLPENKIKAVNSFIRTLLYTGIGEMLDVELPYLPTKKEEQDVLAIYLHKTAHYTITGAMQLGAILGGASEQYLLDLAEFGNNLGIAFQIQDDILGIFGNETDTGKSAISDIEEGKITILYLKALQNANQTELQTLKENYGVGTINMVQAEVVRQVFISTGALVYAEVQKEIYVQKCLEVIPKITQQPDYKDLLQQFAASMIYRKQ
jgi:geranylgeranyl diphosphate synthase, type I